MSDSDSDIESVDWRETGVRDDGGDGSDADMDMDDGPAGDGGDDDVEMNYSSLEPEQEAKLTQGFYHMEM